MSRCWWRWMKTFSLVHCMSHSLIQHQGNVQEVSTGTFLLNMKYCTTDIYRLQRTAFWGFLRAIQKITGWWFGTWMLWLPFSWECHHPNWRSPSFVIGVGQPPTRIDSPYNPYNPYSPCTIHYTELYNHLNQIIKRALIYVHSEGHRSRHIFLGGCFFFGSQDRIPDHDIIGYTAEYQSFHKGQCLDDFGDGAERSCGLRSEFLDPGQSFSPHILTIRDITRFSLYEISIDISRP